MNGRQQRGRGRSRAALFGIACVVVMAAPQLGAEDWLQFRGKERLAVWHETGIVDTFPAAGLPVAWRTPIKGGYSGASVGGGKVFITDGDKLGPKRVLERAIALDEKTGKILWTKDWETDYEPMVATWAIGPVATPTVDEDRVYFLGRMGNLWALNVNDGRVLWQKEYMKDYSSPSPLYGFVSSPLVDGERLICIVGGEGDKKVIAFNKMTGEEIWSALKTTGEPGYGQPTIINYGGARQLIIWHGTAVSSLDPVSGKLYWEVPFSVDLNLTIATPVQSGPFLYIATHYSGARMIRLGETKPTGELLWSSDLSDDGINPASMTPIIDGDYIYGLNGFGILRCLDINTGKRIWETQALTKEHVLYTSAQFVKNADGRYFINNDRGELVMARMTPKGYEEISRTKVIAPTHPGGRRREFGAVSWSYPAYANRHLIIRNDNEIVSYSLAK